MIQIIDPLKIEKEKQIIASLADYGLNHLTTNSNLGWNYILDHVWITTQIEAYLYNSNRAFPIVLDVGCGKSSFHNYLENRMGIHIWGIERPEGYCHQDVTKNVDFLVDFKEFSNFEHGTVDIIYWLSSIEHNKIEDIHKLYKKSIELLRPGGLLLITFPISVNTRWFEESQQTNLSIEDAKEIFEEEIIDGDFEETRKLYLANKLYLKDKYIDRYGMFSDDSPAFLVAGLKKELKESNVSNVHRMSAKTNRPYLFFPSSDTHVHWMLPIAKKLNPVVFTIDPENELENASPRIAETGLSFYEYSPGLIFKIKPSVIIVGNDWGGTPSGLFSDAKLLHIPLICIQEGVLDFITPGSTRMRRSDYAFIQGPIMEQYLHRPRMTVTGNPKYDDIEIMPLPDSCMAMVNCNFTYGIFEGARSQWIQDVINACNETKTNKFVSQHPRDYGILPNEVEIVHSEAKLITSQLSRSSLIITRFSTLIYEALVAGREVIYYNPHGENFGLMSNDETGTVLFARNYKELVNAIILFNSRKGNQAGIPSRENFLKQHIGTIDHNSADLCAKEIIKVVENNVIMPSEAYNLLAQQCEINMGINNDNLEMAKLYESKIGIFIRKIKSVKRKIARKIKKILGII